VPSEAHAIGEKSRGETNAMKWIPVAVRLYVPLPETLLTSIRRQQHDDEIARPIDHFRPRLFNPRFQAAPIFAARVGRITPNAFGAPRLSKCVIAARPEPRKHGVFGARRCVDCESMRFVQWLKEFARSASVVDVVACCLLRVIPSLESDERHALLACCHCMSRTNRRRGARCERIVTPSGMIAQRLHRPTNCTHPAPRNSRQISIGNADVGAPASP
jgi:hypothetical protein